MVALSHMRVEDVTPEHVNQKIRMHTDAMLRFFAAAPHLIDQRLQELEREWDVERVLTTGASGLMLTGMVMGSVRSRWKLLSLAVAGFLLQHSIQGWCPPLEVVRRLGFRTRREIDEERFALRLLRGDFRDLPNDGDAESRVQRVLTALREGERHDGRPSGRAASHGNESTAKRGGRSKSKNG
jgi:hypothetical protein